MRIGVVSDTHGHVANTRHAVEILTAKSVDLVLHCGDIGSPAVVNLFDLWPTHFVFGNTDQELATLRTAILAAEQTCHERFGDIELDGCRIALIHSDDAGLFHDTVHSGDYDLVCYGHTHVAEHHRAGHTLILNPGALYRANPKSLAIVTTPGLIVERFELS